MPRSVDLYDSSPNDPISAAQLVVLELAAGRSAQAAPVNGAQEPAAVLATPQKPQQPLTLLGRLNDNEATPRSSVAGSPAPEGTTPNPDRDTPMGDPDQPPSSLIFRDPVLEKVKIAEERDRTLPLMALDHAILESLAHGGRGDDKKMRDLFGGIVLVGGVAKTPGSATCGLESTSSSPRPRATSILRSSLGRAGACSAGCPPMGTIAGLVGPSMTS